MYENNFLQEANDSRIQKAQNNTILKCYHRWKAL